MNIISLDNIQDNNEAEYINETEYNNESDVFEESLFYKEDIKQKQNNSIRVEIPRTKSSHKICVICNSGKIQKKSAISKMAVIDAYLKTSILIPYGSRSCTKHLNEFNYIKDEEINNLKIEKSYIYLKDSEIKFTMQLLRFCVIRSSFFDKFENVELLDSHLCQTITGNII